MKKIKIIALVLSTVIMLFAINSSFFKSRKNSSQTIEAIIAVQDIPEQTVIKKDMLKKVKILKEHAPENIVLNEDDIAGMVSLNPVFANDVLTSSKVSEPGSAKSGVSFLIPHGERAITLDVQMSTGIAGLLRIGNKVDIVNVDKDKARMVLQNKQVLALDKKISDSQKDAISDQNTYLTITLLLTPEEALELALADENGQNRAILRNPEDEEIKSVKDIKLN